MTRAQLLELGYGRDAIKHRVARGRLHPIRPGVYAVGNPRVSRHGQFLAAVLASGSGAVLSHESAAELWGIRKRNRPIEVTIPADADRRPPGVRVHRRSTGTGDDRTIHDDVPVTSPIRTLLDLAPRLPERALTMAINEADGLDLIDPKALLKALEARCGHHGVRPLRALLERATFRLTDSELERRFLPISARAGLSIPLTQQQLDGYRVDFYFPALGLAVEADSLRYHRTPAQQTADARRDQAHAAAGREHLRFTHFQITYEPGYVESVLRRVAKRRSGILKA